MTTLVKPSVMPPIRACSHPTPFPLNVSKQLNLAISSSVASNKLSTYYEYLVSIAVGKEQKLFRIRKDLLGYRSSCFTKEVIWKLSSYLWTKHSVPGFTLRLHDSLSSPVKLSIARSLKSHEIPLSARFLYKIYVFRYVRGIPGLKNEVIDLLTTRMTLTWVGNLELTQCIYENTPKSSILQNLHEDTFVLTTHFDTLKGQKVHLNLDSILDIITSLEAPDEKRRLTGREEYAKLDRCLYRGQGTSLEKPRHLLKLNALIPCDIVI